MSMQQYKIWLSGGRNLSLSTSHLAMHFKYRGGFYPRTDDKVGTAMKWFESKRQRKFTRCYHYMLLTFICFLFNSWLENRKICKYSLTV